MFRCTPRSISSPYVYCCWLKNQSNKSPEVPRRLILEPQSFTFGHHGNLIESLDVSKSNRVVMLLIRVGAVNVTTNKGLWSQYTSHFSFRSNKSWDPDFQCDCQDVDMERTRKTNKIVLGSAETESTVGTDFSLQRVSLPALRNLGTSKCDKVPIDGQS